MGFMLRFLLGFVLVLAICSSSKSASTWRRMKLLSQDLSVLEPIVKNRDIGDTSSSDEQIEEQKPKTDETNKIVSEPKSKEENVEPISVEYKLDRPLSVTENNDLSKESLESTRTSNSGLPDLNINIEKYLSPEFHDKNNIYKLPTSPDIKKFVDLGNVDSKTTETSLDTTSNYNFDKKLQTIQNDIKKKLGYIDEKFLKSTHIYEETTDGEVLGQSDTVKYKNTSLIGKNGNKVYKDEQVESGQKLDYGSSYIHTVADEQQHISSSETLLDNSPKINETDDLKNKIFRAKTAGDSEGIHEKLNQTERRTALLSNKIEHGNTSENRRTKWSFHYTPTTVPYTTTAGQKEEIMFVPYVKDNPINISKRGSTRFIDTITTQRSIGHKQTNGLDEATLENQIYPVQVPAPNGISKEVTEEKADNITSTVSTTRVDKSPEAVQNVTVTTLPPVIATTQENVSSMEGNTITTKENITTTNDSTTTAGENITTGKENLTTEGLRTISESVNSNFNPETTQLPEITTLHTSIFTAAKAGDENMTFSTLQNDELDSSTTLRKIDTENLTSIMPENENSTTNGRIATHSEEISSIANLSSPSVTLNEENSTMTNTLATETVTMGDASTTGDYVSDQTTLPVVINETTPKNTTPGSITTPKDVEIVQTDRTVVTSTTAIETTTLLPDTTLDTSSSSQASTISPSHVEQTISLKVEDDTNKTTPLIVDDRASNAKSVKNSSTTTEHLPTVIASTEAPIETTTVDYNDNVIKQSDVVILSTEQIPKRVPTNINPPLKPSIERKQLPDFPAPLEPNPNDDTIGNSYTRSDEQDEGSSSGKIAAIVISCIGAVCFVILAILLFVMRKRHKRFNYGQRCTPVSLDAYSVDNVSAYNSVRRKGMMRASKRSYGNPAFEESSVTHLLNFPELMKFGSNSEEIASEYDNIPQISVQTNELPEGCETKNRYANVIPLPESRVFLSAAEECPNSDYINANYVMGPKSIRNYYIACQAPMQSTVDDFWRMIWEQQSRVILMLTHLFENGAEKCFDYLPPSEVLDCHRLFGDFQITLKKREVKEKYVISNLQLKNMVANTWREVTHLWYLGWPERGVPAEENSLVAFLIEARSYIKAVPSENGQIKEATIPGSNGTAEHNPIVIHCSPGTGRTGTVIACDIAIREFELTRQVDIPKTVYQIRRNRAGAVQTKEQYAFIYRVITWYANKLTGGVLDSL